LVNIQIKYSGHIVCITGKFNETISTEAKTLRELIYELDGEYPGLSQMFFPKGIFNLRTMVHIRRVGKTPNVVIDPSFQLRNGDIYLFW
jgi:hypothetical protein